VRGRWWIRPLILLIVVIAGVAVALTIDIPSIDELRSTVAKVGWAGPVLYAAAYASLVLTPIPATISTITAGVLFGLPIGLAVSLTGAVVGASIGFGLSRVLGRGAVERLDSDRLHRLDDLLRRSGLLAVIGVRLVPLLPFAALNYACGRSAVRARDYVLGTAIGILPGAAAYSTIGAFGGDPGSLPFLLALGGLGALTIGGAIVIRRRRKLAVQPRT
jgi:uncharacterized membrane protein YdjX (TVP38/TMEM64 family)